MKFQPAKLQPSKFLRDHPAARLVLVVALITSVWGVLLPRVAETETVRRRNLWLEEKGIDPAAMFYTDLEIVDRVLKDQRPE